MSTLNLKLHEARGVSYVHAEPQKSGVMKNTSKLCTCTTYCAHLTSNP